MKKKERTISLTTYVLTLIIIALVIVALLMYREGKESSHNQSLNLAQSNIEQTETEKNNIDDNNSKSATKNEEKKSKDKEDTKIENISHIVLELEDLEAEKNSANLEYKEKKITDKKKIEEIMKIVDNAEPYTEKSFIPDFGDVPPSATIYFKDGKKYSIMAGDEINDNGNIVNLMCKWYKKDGNDKTVYKVNKKLGECIEKIFNEDINSSKEKIENEISNNDFSFMSEFKNTVYKSERKNNEYLYKIEFDKNANPTITVEYISNNGSKIFETYKEFSNVKSDGAAGKVYVTFDFEKNNKSKSKENGEIIYSHVTDNEYIVLKLSTTNGQEVELYKER